VSSLLGLGIEFAAKEQAKAYRIVCTAPALHFGNAVFDPLNVIVPNRLPLWGGSVSARPHCRAGQRVHGGNSRAMARVRFNLFPKVRHVLRKFVRRPYAFSKGVGAIVEQLLKARVCHLRARTDFQVFRIRAKRVGCSGESKRP
jgi:hypothetical protein